MSHFKLEQLFDSNFRHAYNMCHDKPLSLAPATAPKFYDVSMNLALIIRRILDPIHDEFGPVCVISGFKHQELSEWIGDTPDEMYSHATGCAVDITYPIPSLNLNLAHYIVNNLEFELLKFDLMSHDHHVFIPNIHVTCQKFEDDFPGYPFKRNIEVNWGNSQSYFSLNDFNLLYENREKRFDILVDFIYNILKIKPRPPKFNDQLTNI